MISIIVDVSTIVIVNNVFLFTAGTPQIIIGTKSILDRLFVSLIPRLQIVMGMETFIPLLWNVVFFCTSSSLYMDVYY